MRDMFWTKEHEQVKKQSSSGPALDAAHVSSQGSALAAAKPTASKNRLTMRFVADGQAYETVMAIVIDSRIGLNFG